MPKTIWLYPSSSERKLMRTIAMEIKMLVKEFYIRLAVIKRLRKDDDGEDNPDIVIPISYTEEDSNNIEVEMAALLAWWLSRINTIRITITILFGDINKFNDKQFVNVMKMLTGIILPTSQTVSILPNETVSNVLQAIKVLGDKVDLSRVETFVNPAKSNFVATATNAIESLGTKLINDLNAITRLGMQQNLSEADLKALVSKKLSTFDNIIKNLSRDITTKINSELSRNRQISMGFLRYVWNTQLDERVRPAHVALEATIQSWDNAPSEGHPGSAYMCRCWATPIK